MKKLIIVLGACFVAALIVSGVVRAAIVPSIMISPEPVLYYGLPYIGQAMGFTTPLTITQFIYHNGAANVFTSIDVGCPQTADIELVYASPGYTTNPIWGGCSWIRWANPQEDPLVVQVRYSGFWKQNVFTSVSANIDGVDICFNSKRPDHRCEKVGDNIPANFILGQQIAPFKLSLPFILK